MPFLDYLHRTAGGVHLDQTSAYQAMIHILDGSASTAQIAAFLVALRMKGETADELLGFAQAMRKKMLRVDAQLNGETLLDTCGTGGDLRGTFNISTIATFVIAGA